MKAFHVLALLLSLPLSAVAQWSNDPSQALGLSLPGTFSPTMPKASQASNGDIYVSYIDPKGEGYSYHFFLQRLNNKGEELWEKGGILVDDHTTMSWTGDYAIQATPDGGCVVAWGDSREDPSRTAVFPYAYKVNADGDPVWGIDGVALPADITGITYSVCAVEDGAIFGYHCYDDGDGLFYRMVKVNDDGVLAWEKPIDFDGSWGQFTQTSDGFILDLRMGGKLVAMRYDKDGNPLWDEFVTIESRQLSDHSQPTVKSDGADGIVIAYRREVGRRGIVCVQHLDCDGSKTMGLRSLDLYDEEIGTHDAGVALGVNKDSQELVALWNFQYSSYQLQANKLNFDGDYLWDSELGITIGEPGKNVWGYTAGDVISLQDGWLLVYGDDQAWETTNLTLCKIDHKGKNIWKKTMLEGAHIADAVFLSDKKQGYMIWRNGEWDQTEDDYCIQVQNYTFDGAYGNAESAIQTINSDNGDTVTYFDLQGRRIAKPQAGQLVVKSAK